MNYNVNICAIFSSFYVGTRDLDIGRINSCQGIASNEIWERSYTCHSKSFCQAILKVIDQIIEESLNEEVALTTKEKLKEKHTDTAIEDFVNRKFASTITWTNEVDHVHITIYFDMGW